MRDTGSCSHCDHCGQDEYVASRLTIWETGVAALLNKKDEWPDTDPVTPHDAFLLAQYLAGDTVGDR